MRDSEGNESLEGKFKTPAGRRERTKKQSKDIKERDSEI